MNKAIVLQHVDFEGPSRIGSLLLERGYELEIRALHRNDAVPVRLEQGELLVVMGGPMGVGDLEQSEFPFLKREVELLRQCLEDDAPVLGVCLGSQLLAHAAGAAVYPMKTAGARSYEVGWGPIQFQHSAGALLSGVPKEMHVLHWHGDTFDLPVNAAWLASSARCQNQAFRVGSRQFGLQFHCETTTQDVESWLAADDGFIIKANGEDAAVAIRDDTALYMPQQHDVGGRLIQNILDAMLLPQPSELRAR
jgi:GMP synthase-like glutamine amidotransferase